MGFRVTSNRLMLQSRPEIIGMDWKNCRTRELEARLSEKEMLIHLLQRASMDRDIMYATNGNSQRLPESVSLLNRHPPVTSSQHLLDNHSTPISRVRNHSNFRNRPSIN